jgi:hypothetical protein
MTLNEPLFLESARALAVAALKNGGSTEDERIAYAFRRCLARTPSQDELRELRAFLSRQTPRIQEGWVSAWDLAGFDAPDDQKSLPPGATPAQLAAYTALSRVLLNLDETITKE